MVQLTVLTHWGRDKMVVILQAKFSNTWMKIVVVWFKLHWNFFLRIQLIISQYTVVSGNGLVPNRRETISWANDELGHWRIYVSPGELTHRGRVTHICVGKLTIIGSDNGLSPRRRQAIIWTSAGILVIGPLGFNFSEISIGIQKLSFKKMHLKMSSAKWRPFFLGLNVLTLPWLMPYVCVADSFIDSDNDLLPNGTRPLPFW